jgi:uncharacterized protein YbaR (Trm112 family)
MLDKKLLDILVCPITKGPLHYDANAQELISLSAQVAYRIDDGIPVLLADQARTLSVEELEHWRQKLKK